tara:strand:+ start:9 stop:461 length:453 start_codon:yes stop_codon:yes gene_type:complete
MRGIREIIKKIDLEISDKKREIELLINKKNNLVEKLNEETTNESDEDTVVSSLDFNRNDSNSLVSSLDFNIENEDEAYGIGLGFDDDTGWSSSSSYNPGFIIETLGNEESCKSEDMDNSKIRSPILSVEGDGDNKVIYVRGTIVPNWDSD